MEFEWAIFGDAMHAALGFYYQRLREGAQVTVRDAGDVFESRLRAQFARCDALELPIRLPMEKGKPTEDLESLVLKGRAMLQRYVWEEHIDPREIVAIAEPFAVPIEDSEGTLDRILVGEFDIVLRRPDGLVVLDWKTSGRAYSEAEVRMKVQPVAYDYAARRHFQVPRISFEFHVLKKTREPEVQVCSAPLSDDRIARFIKRLRVMLRMVTAGHFLPVDDPQACSGCPFPKACERWGRTATAAPSLGRAIAV